MLQDLLATLPLGIPALIGCLVLMLDVFNPPDDEDHLYNPPDDNKRYLGWITVAGMLTGVFACYLLWDRESSVLIHGAFKHMMVIGKFELAACALLLIIGAITALITIDYSPEQGFEYGELYALLNFSVFGMMVLVTAVNAVTLFVGLEIMSISIYVMAAIKRTSAFSAEAGLKYFILGAFASGFLLFGVAYLYGETASFEYAAIAAALSDGEPSAYLAISVFMLTAAFGFKIALVPFHMWTPDVYEGAPTSVTALMATGVKTAAVIAFARLFVMALPASAMSWVGPDWFDALGIIAVATMTLGNVVAIQQRNLKRMLAYSSIAHAGYLLIGIMAAHLAANPSSDGGGSAMSAILFYLFTYAFANMCAFAVIAYLGKDGKEDITLDNISGLASTHGGAALVLAIGMLSLAGIPPTAGFFGKLVLFREALEIDSDRFLWLVVVAMLNSVVSVYYYLRVVVHAYMKGSVRKAKVINGTALAAALVISAAATIQVGIFPGKYLKALDVASSEMSAVGAPQETTAAATEAATTSTGSAPQSQAQPAVVQPALPAQAGGPPTPSAPPAR